MNERRSPRRARESAAPYTISNISARDLEKITRRIVRAAHPEMIILFGSRVYGTPHPNSDLDVLVVVDQKKAHDQRVPPLEKLFSDARLKLDVHTRTPSEVTRRLAMGDEFMQNVVGRGQKMYARRAGNGLLRTVEKALAVGRTKPMDNGELVQEWVQRAEGDYEGAQMWARKRKNLRPEKLCWDCEQCAEKYLKAFLTRHRVRFEKIHELDELHALCLTVDADFRFIKTAVDAADICQPKIRYPGTMVTEEQAREAFTAAKQIRKFIRAKLGIA